ncbi:pyridoxal phosphate-dependent aminotransferase [Clostridium sp. 19966]|uniref:MalY/PatB family protein n=1 Tax=Clostridium sp. 19966 TaxID=2768166 RepID=UPI0028DDCD72|nr:MalY/PatB family protein [Clostridium sp. 19966]MDT8717204.1 pyridoxal phosphate-dependent aminotransferase [Clostridium sp. 19966]
MLYNFDEVIERRNTNSVKWDRGQQDVLPLWVADMDFKAAEPIINALEGKIKEGIFGYTIHPKKYYEAVVSWMERRHNLHVEEDWILFCPGVVPALNFIIKALTNPGDKVMIQTPVYHPFYRVIKNNSCEVVENELIFDGNKYEMDYEDLEKKASDPKVKLMILCSPHNPVGRVWKEEELKRLGDICLRNNVIVVSDEIHNDLILGGNKHINFASINNEFSNNTITCTSPSKTFNLAGLQVSNIIIQNKEIREKVENILELNEIGEPNAFAVDALIAAYEQGEEWLNQLIRYLDKNVEYISDYLKENIPEIKLIKPEGTYLLWLDCRELGMKGEELNKFFMDKAKVWLNDGRMFGAKGEGFVRMNVACPKSIIEKALTKIKNTLM